MNAQPAALIEQAWTIPSDHPAFAGHFPGQPILPGVMLIAQALECAAANVGEVWLQLPVQIISAKFLAPLQPGDVCRIELRPEITAAGQRLRFDIRRGDTLAATGVLEQFASATATAP
jgi:3-hydroxymyristoyl/3-hydroxydecanoyl-(acyl carrier protein) dehydratase